jgi:galactose mutarotase-like enzyme
MIQIENSYLSINVNPKGAELQSIYCKDTNLEYLWSGDPDFWGNKSPVLFPIVGGLKNDSYQYNGTTYQLGRHGFARDMEFQLTSNLKESISFNLQANEATQKAYPFLFSFTISYTINKNKLSCTYQITNVDLKPMFFSFGAHPAFKVPLEDNLAFDDYQLIFSNNETAQQWPLTADGLIKREVIDFFKDNNTIDLNKNLFHGDALVFKELESTSISLSSNKSKHGFKFEYNNFPYMGIWSAKNADFVCIEPWCGVADYEDTKGDIEQKEGINILLPSEMISRTWSVEVY